MIIYCGYDIGPVHNQYLLPALNRIVILVTVLQEKKIIETSFGETLSWDYLSWVRAHPIKWNVATEILYGGQDNLTSRDTIDAFAKNHGANLTIMEDGEHWFHTEEQMTFLDEWLRNRN